MTVDDIKRVYELATPRNRDGDGDFIIAHFEQLSNKVTSDQPYYDHLVVVMEQLKYYVEIDKVSNGKAIGLIIHFVEDLFNVRNLAEEILNR